MIDMLWVVCALGVGGIVGYHGYAYLHPDVASICHLRRDRDDELRLQNEVAQQCGLTEYFPYNLYRKE
jgi:hypothetical protein